MRSMVETKHMATFIWVVSKCGLYVIRPVASGQNTWDPRLKSGESSGPTTNEDSSNPRVNISVDGERLGCVEMTAQQ